MARSRRRAPAWTFVLVVLGLVLYATFADQLRPALDLGRDLPPAADDEALRVASWNLRRLGDPEARHDLERLGAELDELDVSLFALQEIHDAAPLAKLRPEWRHVLSEGGGRGHQRLAFWWDPARVEAEGEPVEYAELSMGGSVRPALAQHFVDRASGRRFWAVTVHLKAMPEGADLRREQWDLLATRLEGLRRESAEEPLLLLGDFNVTGAEGSPKGDPPDADHSPEARELAALEQRFGAIGLDRVVNAAGCSAYWDGEKRDATKVPSELDLIWVSGALGATDAWPGMHCARHSCQNLRSTSAYPDLDYLVVSDHCPVVTDLQLQLK